MINDAMTTTTSHDGRPVTARLSSLLMKFRYPLYGLPTALTTGRQQMRWWAIYSRVLAYYLHNRTFRSLAEFAEMAGQLNNAFTVALTYRNLSLLCAR